MNILVTLDANYIRPLSVMLHSLVRADDCPKFDLYIAHSSLTDENIDSIFRGIDRSRFNVHSIRLSHELNADAPTEDRITMAQRMCRMLNEIDDGVLLVRRGNFMTQTIRYVRP